MIFGRGENKDLKLMFLIVLHLEMLNGYFKMLSILYVLFSLLPTWVKTVGKRGRIG